MKALSLLLAAVCAGASLPAAAQADAQCIVVGRLSDNLWAPKFTGTHLFGARGEPIATPTRQALSAVRKVTLDQPALLSKCDGDNALANGDNEPPGTKSQAPALSAGTVDVEGVAFPKLRTGGTLVELRVRVPAERVVMLTR